MFSELISLKPTANNINKTEKYMGWCIYLYAPFVIKFENKGDCCLYYYCEFNISKVPSFYLIKSKFIQSIF